MPSVTPSDRASPLLRSISSLYRCGLLGSGAGASGGRSILRRLKPSAAAPPLRLTASTGTHGVARLDAVAAASRSTSRSHRASSLASGSVRWPETRLAMSASSGSRIASAPPSSAALTVKHASRTKHRSHSLAHCSIGGSVPSANGSPPRCDAFSRLAAGANIAASWFRRCMRCARSEAPGRIASVSSSFLFLASPPGWRV